MGSGGSKLETRPFNCNDNNIKIKKEPYKFKNLEHIRCIFFTQDNYNANYHIPKSTLTLTFYSTISNLENDIEAKIKETYDKINNITKMSDGSDIKILSPIYVAFSRKLEYERNLFDDNDIEPVEVNDVYNSKYKLAIRDYISSFLSKMNNPDLNAKYRTLPMNTYGFSNGKIYVILYFPFITNQYKYITNFKDIINSSSFFIKTITNTNFNGLPDVTTIDEEQIKKLLNNNKDLSDDFKNAFLEALKNKDKDSFRYSDDLTYLCNEGGCISDVGEDFNNLLPSLAKNDSDNNNNAEKMGPFLPTKCLAQTVRFKCGVINADSNNKPLKEIMKDKVIIDYLLETLKKYIINYNCTVNKDKMDNKFCDKEKDKNADLQQTPIDIISYAYSYQLRKKYSSDLNEGDKNHYSKSYNKNIIKELMFLRNVYPGIQEIVFPLYIYKGNNNYITDPPWGPLFLTKDQVFYYNDPINVNRKIFSFNNKYYLTMNNLGHIYIYNYEYNYIYYYLNIITYSNPISFIMSDNITIIFKDGNGNEQMANILNKNIKIVMKDDKRREPFNFYINDDGKIRVYANGFIDATDNSFSGLIDDKINEYSLYGSSPNYLNSFNSRNELNMGRLNIQDDDPIYIDK